MIAFEIDEFTPCLKEVMREFGAAPLPPVNNPYRFMLSDDMSNKVREVYTYEWTDEEI